MYSRTRVKIKIILLFKKKGWKSWIPKLNWPYRGIRWFLFRYNEIVWIFKISIPLRNQCTLKCGPRLMYHIFSSCNWLRKSGFFYIHIGICVYQYVITLYLFYIWSPSSNNDIETKLKNNITTLIIKLKNLQLFQSELSNRIIKLNVPMQTITIKNYSRTFFSRYRTGRLEPPDIKRRTVENNYPK